MCILISFKNDVLLAPPFPFKLRLLLCFLAGIGLGWTCFFSGWACVFVFSCRSAQHSGLCRPRWPSSIPHLPKRTEQGRLPDGMRSQTPPSTQICHLMPWAGPVLDARASVHSGGFPKTPLWHFSKICSWMITLLEIVYGNQAGTAVCYVSLVSNSMSLIIGIICLAGHIFLISIISFVFVKSVYISHRKKLDLWLVTIYVALFSHFGHFLVIF